MENLRSRTRREVEQASQYAIQKFAKELTETVDILQLAMDSVPKPELEKQKSLNDLFVGVSMTRKELLKCLARYVIFQKHLTFLAPKRDIFIAMGIF